MIEFALAAYLATRPAVTQLVAARIYADHAAQSQPRPLLVYRVNGGRRHYHSLGSGGLAESVIDLACEGKTYEQARALYETLRNELDGFQGTWGTAAVRRVTLSPPVSPPPALPHGDEQGYPSLHASLDVCFRESIPTFAGAAP